MKRKLAIVALLVGGLACLFQGSFIYAKALVAQVLLRNAWSETQRGTERARPWPWADTWPVARLLSLEHEVDLVVLEGATGSTTAFGPGHLLSTAKPGRPGHLAIAGHRDTHFAFLEHVRVGEVLWLEPANGEAQRFVVEGTQVVDEAQTQLLEQRGDLLSLITCYPFDAKVPGGPLRYVVRARALPQQAASEEGLRRL